MSPRLSDLFLGSQSDERLVSLARSGHERAFATIVERYRGELHALARRLCADGGAEDIVQQTFLSAFAALRSGAEVKHLRGWLYTIARNAATRSRAPASVPLDGTTASDETVEEIVQQRAMAMTALTELSRLPTRQRQAMVDTALGGMPRAEVASTMGLSEGAVRQLVHRARVALRTAVTAVTPWPVARWFAAMHPDVPGPPELTAGACAASTGGVAIKLGALLASGALVTGVAAVDLHRAPAHRPGAHSAAQAHARASAGSARAGTLVSPARRQGAPPVADGTPRIVRVGLLASRSSARTGAGADLTLVRGARHEPGAAGSRARHDSQSGRPDGTGRGGGGGSGRRDGEASRFSAGSSSGRPYSGEASRSGGGSAGGRRGSIEPAGMIASGSGWGEHQGDRTVAESHDFASWLVRSGPDAGAGGGRGGSGGSDGGFGGVVGGSSRDSGVTATSGDGGASSQIK